MTGNLDDVRARFEEPETIAPVDGLAPSEPPRGDRDGPPPDGPDAPHPSEPYEAASQLPLNDFGNGQRYVLHFGRDSMFVPRVGWFTWDGKVWRKDPDMLSVRRNAQRMGELIEREVVHLVPTKREQKLLKEQFEKTKRLEEIGTPPPGEEGEELRSEAQTLHNRLRAIEAGLKSHKSRIGRHLTHAKNAGNSGPLGHMLEEAQPSLAAAFEDLDAPPLDVCCESGVLRFAVDQDSAGGMSRTASVAKLPHHRDMRLTKMVKARYRRDAQAPLFERFLMQVQPDREMREFIQRWLGLCMTGLPVQKLAFFYGSGANGKSVLVDVVARILDSYAATARIESLTGSNRRGGGDATPDLIPLMGARMVRTSEPDEGQRLQEGLIKELTGGEPLLVRALQQDFVEVQPVFKLTISGNHKPEIRGTDDGIWRRVMLVPFDVQIPEAERDPELVEKLIAESDGIFRWLVDGLCDYLEQGLAPPATVIEATREYREEQDPLGVFLTDCCNVTGLPKDTITSKDLCAAFNYHLLERGLSPWKPVTVSKRMATKARQWRHPDTGRQFTKGKASVSNYSGVGLTDTFKHRFDAAPKDHRGEALGVANLDDADTPHPDDMA